MYAESVEDTATEQIKQMLDQPFAEGADVRIMPDVHAGAGCVIGFTAKLTDKVVPNLIGGGYWLWRPFDKNTHQTASLERH